MLVMSENIIIPEPAGKRAALLDLFRIILCLGVFVYHLTPIRCSSGPFSVNGFLVMSGFLVGISVFGGRAFDSHAFYGSKCRRLLPMMMMAFLLAVIWKVIYQEACPPWSIEDWGNFSIVAYVRHFNTPMWYMVVEVILLLSVPFLVFMSRAKWRLELSFVALVIFVGFLFCQVPDNEMFGGGLYYSPLVREWQFLAGILAARYAHQWQIQRFTTEGWYKWSLGLLFTVFLISMGVLMVLKQTTDLNAWNYTFEFDAITTSFYVLLIPGLYYLRPQISRGMSHILARGAALTYPIFLIHVVARHVCEIVVTDIAGNVSYVIIAVITFIVSLIVAWGMLGLDQRIQGALKKH